jgi:multiple sugar transport system permease protein
MDMGVAQFIDTLPERRVIGTLSEAWQRVSKNTLAYSLMLPSLLFVFAVTVYPIIFALDFSLYSSDLVDKIRFIGLDNYAEMLTDKTIWGNLLTSFFFVFGSILLAVFFGLLLALILSGRIWMRALFRAIILVPWVTSYLIAAMLWKWLLNTEYGPITAFLLSGGLPKLNFLGEGYVMLTLIFCNVWRSLPFAMIIMLAALQTIPENLYKASSVDGASWWMSLWRVTLPLIRPNIMVCVILLSLMYFNIITLPLILTGGGPSRRTEIISLRLYYEAFEFYNTGFASAMAIFIFVINVILTLAYIRALKRKRKIY